MGFYKSTYAGTWYPATARQIELKLNEFSEQVEKPKKLRKPAQAGVVPHAGWLFAGPIAYEVWSNLAERQPDLVVLFGGHMQQYQRSLMFSDEGFVTPLGPIHTDLDLVHGLASAFRFRLADEATWQQDGTTEVHLPMIQHLMPKAKILVMHLPPRDTILDIVDLVMEFVRRRDIKAVFAGSTVLTRYGEKYRFNHLGSGEKAHKWVKNENDTAFINKLVTLDFHGVLEEGQTNSNAYCPGAAAAAVTSARLLGSEFGELLTHMTSWEVAPIGDPTDFVGYCSVLF